MMTFKLDDREFTATLRKYAEVSRREPADICNKKALFIARGAIHETRKADIQKLTGELGATEKWREIKRGPNIGKLRRAGLHMEDNSLAEKIIWARIARKGGAKPTSEEAKKMAKRMVSARRKSVAFIKSGWIPAIRILGPLVKSTFGAPPMDKTAKEVGARKKGGAIAAIAGMWRCRATIFNTALARHTPNKGALLKYGGEGLQKAFNRETQSMKEEIERRLRGNAQQLGIKTN